MHTETQHKQAVASSIKSLFYPTTCLFPTLSTPYLVTLLHGCPHGSRVFSCQHLSPSSMKVSWGQSLSYSLYPQYLVQCWHVLDMALSECFSMNSLIFINWFPHILSCVAHITIMKVRFFPFLSFFLSFLSFLEIQILLRDSWCDNMLRNKDGEFKTVYWCTKTSWCRNPMSLFSGVFASKKLTLCSLFPS